MSSSFFSFSSSDDEGDHRGASEGRIVVASSRALSNFPASERGGDDGRAEDRDTSKRKSSGKKRRRKDDRRRRRDDSSSDMSSCDEDDKQHRRRRHRKKRKSKKKDRESSKRDRKKRRRKHHRDSRSRSRSRSRSVSEERKRASSERRLPKPSSGRSFASVSKGFSEIRPPSPKLLMIEDGKAEDDGTRDQSMRFAAAEDDGTRDQSMRLADIDFFQSYREACLRNCCGDAEKERQSLFLPIDYQRTKGDESDLNQLFLDKQKRLNKMVRANSNDTDAWLALANLHQPMGSDSDANNKSREVASLKRKREILTRAVKSNLESIALRLELIGTLERLCLLSTISEEVLEAESDGAIRMFEVLTHPSSSNVHSLITLHRMRLRRLQRRTQFNAHKMRDSFVEAFSSVSKACGGATSTTPPEMAVLFLDCLRAEAMMGYSERAVAMIQAAIEINLRRQPENDDKSLRDWKASFCDFWNSEFPRIGDVYPNAGWLAWEEDAKSSASDSTREKAGRKKKMKRRMMACDFFGENGEDVGANAGLDRAQSLAKAYESASAASQSTTAEVPSSQETEVGHILGAARSVVEKEEARKRRREREELEMRRDDNLVSEAEVFAAEGTDIAPSQIEHPRAATHSYVYSFLLNRRIEVSRDELTGEATKNSLRRTLSHLKKRKSANESTGKPIVKSKEELYIIQEDDTFLRWAAEEAKTQDMLFLLPRRSSQDQALESEIYDPNRNIWLEDSIQWVVMPFLSNFDDCYGMPSLLSVCLEFLGMVFPRSWLADSFDRDRYVLGPSSSGGERLAHSTLNGIFDGVFQNSEDDDRPNPLSDSFSIYRQLLVDESTVVFDERIFDSEHGEQRKFIRNLLFDVIARTEPGTNIWRTYLQMALVEFEARASGEKATEVVKSILVGSEEAKNDPRLVMAYASLEFKRLRASGESHDSSKAYKSVSKILLTALEAGGCDIFRGSYSHWWFELAWMVVRALLCLPIGEVGDISTTTLSSVVVASLSSELRDKILHIICCVIEGTYQPLPKTKKSKKKHEEASASTPLVDGARLLKCMLNVRSKIAKNESPEASLFSSHPSTVAFDCTPTIFYVVILSSWLTALDPKNCHGGGINYSSGMAILDDFTAMIEPQGDNASGFVFLVRLTHAKLEMSLLQYQESKDGHGLPPSSSFADCLEGNVAQQRSLGIVPSKSLALAVAFMENHSPNRVKNGYNRLLLCPAFLGGIYSQDILYLLAKAVATADRSIIAPNSGDSMSMARCSRWTKDSRQNVEKTILYAIEKSGYCCYPSLYSALLQLKLLGPLQSSTSRGFRKASSKAKEIYHTEILPKCSFSKTLWLDAFMLLRPTYSDVEMFYHMAAMEEKNVRLKMGLEGIMRMAGS